MLSFKEFILEAILYKSIPKTDKLGYNRFLDNHISNFKQSVKVSDIDKDHELHSLGKSNSDSHPNLFTFGVVHKKTGQIKSVSDLYKYSTHKNTNSISFAVHGVAASETNTLPVHKVYAHMINHHGMILVSSKEQTVGGKHIWDKLSRNTNVAMHGWDDKTQKPINLGNYLDDKTENDTHIDSDELRNGENKITARTVLVAHKKGKHMKDFKTFLMEKYGSVSEAADSVDEEKTKQGSTYDRGDADAYYGRQMKPHKMVNGNRVEDLTDEEKEDYKKGYTENPSGTKQWE